MPSKQDPVKTIAELTKLAVLARGHNGCGSCLRWKQRCRRTQLSSAAYAHKTCDEGTSPGTLFWMLATLLPEYTFPQAW